MIASAAVVPAGVALVRAVLEGAVVVVKTGSIAVRLAAVLRPICEDPI